MKATHIGHSFVSCIWTGSNVYRLVMLEPWRERSQMLSLLLIWQNLIFSSLKQCICARCLIALSLTWVWEMLRVMRSLKPVLIYRAAVSEMLHFLSLYTDKEMSDEETVKLISMISHLADDLKITYSLSGLGLSMISIGVKHIQIIVR